MQDFKNDDGILLGLAPNLSLSVLLIISSILYSEIYQVFKFRLIISTGRKLFEFKTYLLSM